MIPLFSFIAIIALSFFYYAFDGMTEGIVGWQFNDIIILLLTMNWALFTDWHNYPKLKLSLIIYTTWRLTVAIYNLLLLDAAFAWWFIAIEAAVFTAWIVKTFSMLTVPESDKYNPNNYMIGIAPYRAPFVTTLNSLLPQTKVICGGRVVVGGDWMWLSRGGKFKRLKVDKPYLKTMILLDTGKPVNKFTDSNLNKHIGKRNWYIFHNCKALDVGVDISHLVRKNERV